MALMVVLALIRVLAMAVFVIAVLVIAVFTMGSLLLCDLVGTMGADVYAVTATELLVIGTPL